jgi:outer membrane cobalamin receptor
VRRLFVVFCLFVSFFASTVLAADLKLKVVDPHNQSVSRARVAVYPHGSNTACAIQNTSVEGAVNLRSLAPGAYRVQVLALGFAAQTVSITLPQQSETTVQLRVAAPTETVTVSATLTPLAGGESATDVSSLNIAELTNLNPPAASEALRFMPGVVVNATGRRGGMASLFVRGGESTYKKVLVDGVPVNEPGGTFNFGLVPMEQVDRLEMVRGAESTLYGSDAMTSVVQLQTRSGSTRTPELTFGSDGGKFETAHGYAALSGARGRFDYNVFGDQFNSNGQGVNDSYSNSSQGVNLGYELSPRAFLRVRTRHANARAGVQGAWNFHGQAILPPDADAYTRQNDLISSAELNIAGPSKWQHRLAGFEYNHQREDADRITDPARAGAEWGVSDYIAHINRAGFDYQSDYQARSWARSVFGYHFEDENGLVGNKYSLPLHHALRRNHAVFGEQILTWQRLSLIGGLRFEHNESFGDKAVPRVAASYLVRRGGNVLGGTRLRFSYGQGIKAPSFDQVYYIDPRTLANPNLKPEENRSYEAGFEQAFATKYVLTGTYFNNLFRNQIGYIFDSASGKFQLKNINEALAHGAELNFHATPLRHLRLDAAYTYTASQYLKAPSGYDVYAAGNPLIRRPKHSGTMMATWTNGKWGADVAGTFIGRRSDSDFQVLATPITYAAGYARVDVGAWRVINSRVTAYVNLGNVLNRRYEEVVGYPALGANFRAGMRFRLGGE